MSKTVWITGGSRGIGAASVRLFAAKGWQVAFTYLNSKSAANALAEETGARAIRADGAESAQVNTACQTILDTFGHIDALVNNAGIAAQQLLTDMTDEDWHKIMRVNLDSVFYCSRAVIPHMVQRKSGSIVNLSSIWGIAGASCEAAYSASKAGIIGLTKALAKELGLSGIRVNCVAPGVVATEMNANLDEETLAALKEETPLNTIGTPEDIAQAIYFLASNSSKFITGQVLSPNGGIVI